MGTKHRVTLVSNLLVILLSISLAISACGPGQAFGPTLTPTPTITPTSTSTSIPPTQTSSPTPTLTPTNTPTPTPTLSFEIPTPREGRGTIVGRILNAGQPVSDMEVHLCGIFNAYIQYTADFGTSPCGGNRGSANIDSNGYYIFSDVLPGGYQAIVVDLPNNNEGAYYNNAGTDLVNVDAGQIVFFNTKDMAQKPYQENTVAATPTLTPVTSCSVPNGDWSGDTANVQFTVDNCTIIHTAFTIIGNNEKVTISLEPIPIVNDGFQYSTTLKTSGNAAQSSENVEFSGTFISPTEFKGILGIAEGSVTIRASASPPSTPTPVITDPSAPEWHVMAVCFGLLCNFNFPSPSPTIP